MGKYNSSAYRPPPIDRNRVHPVMRGIGCVMIVIIPIFSYALADFLINGPGSNWPLPAEWLGTPKIPAILFKLQGLAGFAGFLQGQTGLLGKLILATVFIIILGGLMSVIYGYAFSLAGPPRYGPTDVPPPRVKTKRYKR
jgi:hypothetical protein